MLAHKGQYFRACQRAKHRSADHAARVFGNRQIVAVNERLRRGLARREESRGVDAPIAHRGLFRHRIDAMGGGDQGSSIVGDQPALDRAPRLHQFGCNHYVDFSRNRHQCQYGILSGGRGRPGRK